MTAPEPRPPSLAGRRVLLVEDEYFIAQDVARALRDAGAEIVGPASNVDDALDLVDAAGVLDAAVLDLNLQGEMAYPVADLLLARGVPFVFATGYDERAIPPRYAGVAVHHKPVDPAAIARALLPRR